MRLDPGELVGERWFADKDRRVAEARVVDSLEAAAGAALLVVEIEFSDGPPALYTVPTGVGEPGLWPRLLDALGDGGRGRFELRDAASLGRFTDERLLGIDQSNTSYVLDERIVLKCYRRLQAGVHPEVELVTALRGLGEVPAWRGSLHYTAPDGSEWALALLQDYVPGARDGWAFAEELLQSELTGRKPGTAWAADLGAISRRLHDALATAFGERPARAEDLRTWRCAAEEQLDAVLGLVGDAETARELRDDAPRIARELARLEAPAETPLMSRVHGDYHLGQILQSAAGFHVVDFEGEPTKTPEDRRAAGSPLRDVAAMLRSFDHLARWVLREDPREESRLAAEAWVDAARGSFLEAYGPYDAGLLRAFEVEKETYEFSYAATYLPSWLFVPRASMRALLEAA